MQTILITAFEPFGGKDVNTSAEVLRLLPEEIGGCSVRKKVLPVVFGKAAEQALQEEADAVFMLGEAGGRTTVTPEIRAVNRRDARIPDNDGNQPSGEQIVPGGMEFCHTRIAVRLIAEQMREEGYRIGPSEDAGTFVCNDTFYSVAMNRRTAVFLHCPANPDSTNEYAETVRRFVEIAIAEERTKAKEKQER